TRDWIPAVCSSDLTPTLPAAAEPGAAGDCAPAAPVLTMLAAARAAVRVNIFRDRRAVNNLEFTFLSLLWRATEEPGRTRAKSAWLETDSTPCGLCERIANLKV